MRLVGHSRTSTLLIPSQGAVLAQPHLEEDQEQTRPQPNCDQGDCEQLAGQPADEEGAYRTRDREPGGRPECDDSSVRSHGPKVPAHVKGLWSRLASAIGRPVSQLSLRR